ncbi:hypothetical protein [Methylorubrum populi]|uniref:Uncharacterized protein n=1 Tax=Methylorubrum populi TaxID=223967 RepID=A0A921E230_9HYPH|nr:hypothetical protein [Methylorubrum populi]
MSLDSGPQTARGPLSWSIKVTLILGLAATALAHHVAKPPEKPLSSPQQTARLPGDPEVTGSIGPRARETRLDPCLRPGARDD